MKIASSRAILRFRLVALIILIHGTLVEPQQRTRILVAGPRGKTGPQGTTGPQGAAGIAGAKGDTGPAGLTGPAGAAGATGPMGIRGPQGDQGTNGVTGSQGTTGANGATGPAGLQGATGPQGPPGTSATPIQQQTASTGALLTVSSVNAYPAYRVFDFAFGASSAVADLTSLNGAPVTESQFAATCSRNNTVLSSLFATMYVNVDIQSSNPTAILQLTTLVRFAAAGSSSVLLQPFVDTLLTASANFTQTRSVQQAQLAVNLVDSVACQAGDRFVFQTRSTLLNDPLATDATVLVAVTAGLSIA